jgi:hypothetical protein
MTKLWAVHAKPFIHYNRQKLSLGKWGEYFPSPLPQTHAFSFVDENNISKEYNNNVFVSIKYRHPCENQPIHICKQSHVSSYKRKRHLRASHATAKKNTAQLWGLLANWWSNLTIESKMASTMQLTLSRDTAMFSFSSLLRSNITGDHKRETSHEMRSSSVHLLTRQKARVTQQQSLIWKIFYG